MEQRKLIKLGNSSFAIALPKSWVDKAGLKKGDNIFIEENGNGELIIQPSAKEINGERGIEINVQNKDIPTLRREITAGYIKGYNYFNIKGERNRETNAVIRRIISGLLGLEIIKHDSKEIIAKDLFNMEEINIDNFIRRIDNNVREMFIILMEACEKEKISKAHLSDLKEADADINKFQFLISRILAIGVDNPSILIKLKTESISLINNWWLAFNLEHIGDEIKSLAEILETKKPEHKKECERFPKLLERLEEIYKSSMDLFYKKEVDNEEALNIISKGKKLWDELNKLTLHKDSLVARAAMKLKEIESYSYQNIKMILNN